jgi:hypothetical protein
MIAAYFGYAVPIRVSGVFAPPKTVALLVATALALLAVASRLTQNYLEARTMTRREQAFAIRMSTADCLPAGNLNLVRAANHYGRLAAVSMKAASTILVLIVSAVVFPAILPASYLATFAVMTLFGALALYLVMKLLYQAMETASTNMFLHAKEAAGWKLQADTEATDGVAAFFRAYFLRVFLASAFGVTGMAFAVVFCVFMLTYQLVDGGDIGFGDAFVVFMVLQAYLGLLGRLFGAAVQGAAFLPSVRPFLRPEAGAPYDAAVARAVPADLDDML